MIQVYEYEGNLLFLENAEAPIGSYRGSIIREDDTWLFFPTRAHGFGAKALEELHAKLLFLASRVDGLPMSGL